MGMTRVVRWGGENLPEVFGVGFGVVLTVLLFGSAFLIGFFEQLLAEWSIEAHMPEADRIRTFFETTLA